MKPKQRGETGRTVGPRSPMAPKQRGETGQTIGPRSLMKPRQRGETGRTRRKCMRSVAEGIAAAATSRRRPPNEGYIAFELRGTQPKGRSGDFAVTALGRDVGLRVRLRGDGGDLEETCITGLKYHRSQVLRLASAASPVLSLETGPVGGLDRASSRWRRVLALPRDTDTVESGEIRD